MEQKAKTNIVYVQETGILLEKQQRKFQTY